MIKLIIFYLISFVLSDIIVRLTFSFFDKDLKEKTWKKLVDLGFIIGRCENFIIITLILLNEFVALGLIFTAKSIARVKKMEEKPEYYLLGTLVNFTISFLFGLIIKQLLN